MIKKLLKNERGLTLIELLAVFVIGAIILLLVSNVMIGIQKQYKQQSADAESLFDVSYAVKVITKDFRMSEKVILQEGSYGDLTLMKPDNTEITYHYNEAEQVLYKNENPFIREVTDFTVAEKDGMYAISISNINGKSVETELIPR